MIGRHFAPAGLAQGRRALDGSERGRRAFDKRKCPRLAAREPHVWLRNGASVKLTSDAADSSSSKKQKPIANLAMTPA